MSSITDIRAWAYTAERSRDTLLSSPAIRSDRSTEPSPAKVPSASRKQIWLTASRALRYAARTSSAVITEAVPLSPYWDMAP